MRCLRHQGHREELSVPKIIPFKPTLDPRSAFINENTFHVDGIIFGRNVFVSREINSGPKRRQKINRLDQQFRKLVADAQAPAAEWQMELD